MTMASADRADERIPDDVACHLCEEVQRANRGKWYTFGGLWCLGCRVFSSGAADEMCFRAKPTNRGCKQVNALYADRYELWQRT